jgi:hypothetical protein
MYRVVYVDTLTGTPLGELPVDSFSYNVTVNEPGGWTASLPLRTAQAGTLGDSAGRLELAPGAFAFDGRTAVVFEKAGVIVAGGPMWTCSVDWSAGNANIGGSGWLGWLNRRLITADVTYSGVDQTEIAWDLVDTTQAASTIGFINGVTPSGVLRDRTYSADDATTVLQQLQNLSNVRNGIDFGVYQRWATNGDLEKVFTAKLAESRYTQTIFDADHNIIALGVTLDGTAVNSSAWAYGDATSTGQNVINASVEAHVPRLEAVEVHPTVRNDSTLLGHAERLSQRGSAVAKTAQVTLSPDAAVGVGTIQISDQVQLRAAYGWLDVTGLYRVTGMSVNVQDVTETVTVNVASEELFA